VITKTDLVWMTVIDKRMDWCREQARLRTERAIQIGRGRRNASPPNDSPAAYTAALLGLLCEAAAMIYLSPVTWLYEVRDDVRGLHDLEHNGAKIDVKGCGGHGYHLVIQPGEPPDWIYVLVTAPAPPIVCLRGWCWGWNGMVDEYRGTNNPTVAGPDGFWIPQHAPILRSMRELRVHLHGRGAR